MAPEILIVGDEARLADIRGRIRAFGYRVRSCSTEQLAEVLRTQRVPDALLLSILDADPVGLMAGVRRIPKGAAIPVILFGERGEGVADLADVLYLGAYHVI